MKNRILRILLFVTVNPHNHFDYLKGKYGAWLRLKNKTGNVYDPSTNTFNLTLGQWDVEIKVHFLYVESLRTTSLPFPDLCAQLFEGGVSTGVASFGPSSKDPEPSVEPFHVHDVEEVEVVTSQPSNIASSYRTNARTNRRANQPSSAVDDDIMVVLKGLVGKHESPEKLEIPSYNACLQKLNEFELEQEDPLYVIAMSLLGDKDNGEPWMGIPKEFAKKWIKMVGDKQGYKRRRNASTRIERVRDNSSAMSGHPYTQELLHGPSIQCQELMRMSREAYILLCDHSKQKGWVKDGRYVCVEEKMAIVIKRRFQRSTETVHNCFHDVLRGMMNFAREMICHAASDTTTTTISNQQRHLREIFPGATGALDETLIHAIVPASHQTTYRGRGGGRCYQNVLGICDFNMMFTFVWAGWEGIAHDSRVLNEIAFNPNSGFPFPSEGKYYLCDAAYSNARRFLAPYRNTRYWLADFRCRRALSKEERFNHAHAQLRNIIERAYGVLKARFPILKQMVPFPFTKQRNVVIACFAIHNFIRKCKIQDQLFMEFNEETVFTNDEEDVGNGGSATRWDTMGINHSAHLPNSFVIQCLIYNEG
ncbi:hypothetical protein OSB04_031101 [Centaurea solstitialis]|uniref:DDE Tnp4 domain-containing protein n=1 Tax=Centaurea solstitialis TaxID=347529 RepID=A0AA38SGE7_9ASTR|nr:hypothetical protein OSB04_031101 [Centaurea solstitialis]